MSGVDLSIIILNYNTKDFLLECLQSIKEADLSGIKTEIIVVDNASTDGSDTAVSNFQFPNSPPAPRLRRAGNFQIIKNKRNVGFAAGNNIGMKKSSGRYMLFLNPDTVLSRNAIKEVFNFMEEHKDVAVATSKLELPSGEIDEASHRGFPTPWNAFCHFSGISRIFPKSKVFTGYTKGWLLGNKNPHEVDSVSGAFFFVRRKAAKEVGWWDEDYFWYGDELDFCYRLKEGGWKVFFLPQIKVLHYRGVASGIKGHSKHLSTANKETRKRSARASIKAMRIFYTKHYIGKYPKVITWLVLFGIGLLEKIRVLKVGMQR